MRLRPTRGTASAGLLLTASVVYNDWVLQFFLPTGLHQRDSYVSELFAADQPYRLLFSLVEISCAVLVVTGGALAWSILPGGWASAGGAATVAFGMFSIADVLLPLHCAPSVERGCPEGSPWHTTTSGMVHFVLFASMALFIIASRHGHPPLELVRRWGPWLLAVSMTAAILTVGPFFGHPGGHGLAQRIHLASVGAWLALLAVAIFRYGAEDGPSSCQRGDVGQLRRAKRCRLPRR
ncbi:DUF998 domain-containing protein [Streptomyces platensis]|uniref:DUF998 domain-containing protein n=1 Tax=Streptomyces platensis TaxID=58346 RepID=UPI002E15AFB5|nr:DUF998 domain-containing protein [Streptomyces platensis]